LIHIEEWSSGMKNILSIIAISAAIFATPVMACDQHQSHAMKTVEAVTAPPAPTMVIEPAAQSNPASEIKTEDAMSKPLGAAYEGCSRQRKGQTVYLTQ
jgi:hypothetical protein